MVKTTRLLWLLIGVAVCLFAVEARALKPPAEYGRDEAGVGHDSLERLNDERTLIRSASAFDGGLPGALLVDRSHGQDFNIGEFTDALEAQGWLVHEATEGPLEFETLRLYDVVLVPTEVWHAGIDAFSKAEIEAVLRYLDGGAGLWIFSEYHASTVGVNSLAAVFGVEFQDSVVSDPVDYDPDHNSLWPYIRDLATHPVTEAVTVFRHISGCGMVVSAPSEVVAKAGENATAEHCPAPPPVLAAYNGVGRVVFSCDITPLNSTFFTEQLTDDECVLLGNIIAWLRGPQSVKADRSSVGQLKGRFGTPRVGND